MDRSRLVALLAFLSLVTGQQYYLASDGNYYPVPPPPAEAMTTEEPESSTWNRFNEAGWKTDDNGNVFIGDDNAKIYLISVGSFWPFPKDYKKRSAEEEE